MTRSDLKNIDSIVSGIEDEVGNGFQTELTTMESALRSLKLAFFEDLATRDILIQALTHAPPQDYPSRKTP